MASISTYLKAMRKRRHHCTCCCHSRSVTYNLTATTSDPDAFARAIRNQQRRATLARP